MLSNAFKPIFIRRDQLVRVGSLYDGGYVLTKELINNTKYLISFGISDNFDFEEDLHKLTKCSVVGYDYSINQRFWIERFKKDLVKFFSLKIFKLKKIKGIFKYFRFLFFFNKNNNKFFLKKISLLEFTKILEICKKKKKNNIFLKSDIEGSEYDFLNKINKYHANIIGFAIEFHNLEKKSPKLKKFIINNKYYKLIHVHGNNLSSLDKYGDPTILEMTFCHNKYLNNFKKKNNRKYPIKGLDFPNAKRAKDVSLYFR
jgi:hypothetical protein